MEFSVTELVKVALIMSIPTTVVGIGGLVLGFLNRSDQKQIKGAIGKMDSVIGTIEKNTNDMLTKITLERNAAATRADRSEGKAEGKAEQQAQEHRNEK
jgi:hypothetical protein